MTGPTRGLSNLSGYLKKRVPPGKARPQAMTGMAGGKGVETMTGTTILRQCIKDGKCGKKVAWRRAG